MGLSKYLWKFRARGIKCTESNVMTGIQLHALELSVLERSTSISFTFDRKVQFIFRMQVLIRP